MLFRSSASYGLRIEYSSADVSLKSVNETKTDTYKDQIKPMPEGSEYDYYLGVSAADVAAGLDITIRAQANSSTARVLIDGVNENANGEKKHIAMKDYKLSADIWMR